MHDLTRAASRSLDHVFDLPEWRELQAEAERLTPPIPRTAEEMRAQGFVVLPADALPDGEPENAREFWAGYGVRKWYLDRKPWAWLVGELARAAGAASVLE